VQLRSVTVVSQEGVPRDLAVLVVPRIGELRETEDPWEPYRLLDAEGCVVTAVAEYLHDLQAAGRPAATQRSYGMDLLRWFRFCWAVGVPWNQATRTEACDFSRWIQNTGKPGMSRRRDRSGSPSAAPPKRLLPGTPNPVTGKPAPARTYATATVLHCETVLRGFYEYHLQAGTGPIVNPFPLARAGRAHAHHNPMDPFGAERAGLFRPRASRRLPRHIPDGKLNELFAALSSDRDRALVAFWISTGVRASELLGVLNSCVDAGQQLVTVVRKGSRALQQVPASPDAFVWLRLYQQQMRGLVPAGPDDPVWWTLRPSYRQLTYHAARAMFGRANAALGANWSLHDLRHSAAYRLARDPQMPITDVQWILGHAHLSTTQIYVRPTAEDVVQSVLAHHRRQAGPKPPCWQPAPGYRAETLRVLFGQEPQ
jgi:site-specific recombinase XerC